METSKGLLRTRFIFGTESEIRYIVALPAVGDPVAHRRALWRVTSASEDELGFSIVCMRLLRAAHDADSDPV